MTFQASPGLPIAPVASSDKALMILSHLSALLGVGILLPFIVWLIKRRDTDGVAAHAAAALNFHLSLLLYCLLAIPLCLIVIGLPLLVGMGLASVVLAVLAAIRASDGILFRYPLTIPFVR